MDYLVLAIVVIIVLSIAYFLASKLSPRSVIVRKAARLINEKLRKQLIRKS